MLKQYEAETKILTSQCPKCGLETSLELKELSLYSSETDPGVYFLLPKCSCGSQSNVYSGVNPIEHLSCHAYCVIAHEAFRSWCRIKLLGGGKTEQEELNRLKEKLDGLGLKYESGSVEHQQFLGIREFSFSR